MSDPLLPGATIGILGGGQLGRMLSVAASRLGLRCHVFDPTPDPPAGHVAQRVTTASYDDDEALEAFGSAVDVITYEFENVPTSALDRLEQLASIRPGRNALATSQDRLDEKTFLQSIGLSVAPFFPVGSSDDLHAAVDELGVPAILKTRRFGYDGKGQVRLLDLVDLDGATDLVGDAPAILEGLVEFDMEISVIACRSVHGDVAAFDPGRNEHVDGILRTTTVPAPISDVVARDAIAMARVILDALDYVGVLGVEFFVTPDGLLINEIAPRVHNSGHWTQNGCVVDQFEQHIRAVAGWPLGSVARHSDVVMTNLIGEDIDCVESAALQPNVAVHAYGKVEAKPGRKMGHVNRIGPRLA